MNTRVSFKNRFSKRQRLHSFSTDWGIFRSSLDRIEDVGEALLRDGNLDAQSTYSSFTSMISDCLSFASPKNNTSRTLSSPRPVNYRNPLSSSYQSSSKLKKRSSHCPWWSEECDELVARRKIALDNFKKSGTRDNFLLYKRECAKARIGLKNIKKENFRKFCESLRKDSNPTYIWKKVKSFQNYLNSSDSPNKYNQAIVNTIKNQISSLFPPWARCAQILLPVNGFDPILDLPFVVEELNAVLNNLKLKSSPGLDNIDYKIISNLPNSARSFLLKLYV